MALTQLKWVAEVSIADNSGAVVPRFYESDIATFADYDTFEAGFTTLRSALQNMTDGVIASYKLSAIFINDALALPASGVENENQAFFSGKISDDPTDSATQSIPAAKPGIFVTSSGPGANVVDMGDAAVIAWVALFDETGPGPWLLSDGEHWKNATVKGKRRHTKNSNG